MSYKRLYRCEIRANTVKAKQKRQMAVVLYTKELSLGKRIINIDESTIDQTAYLRKGWGPKGQQLYTRDTYRLYKFNIIAAVSFQIDHS